MYHIWPTCLVLFSFFSTSHCHPHEHNIEVRQASVPLAATSWTSMPSVPTPRPTCNAATTTSCYGFDATWTIVKISSMHVTSNTYGIPSGSPTLLAVSTMVTPSGGGNPTPTIMWPPPGVVVNVGQRVRIALVNQVPDEKVTLHFHGILMAGGYGSMDGPEMVTQCGVSKGQTSEQFIYDFVAKDAGTYWIHSHDPGQYPKGLRAPLIVKNTQGDNDDLEKYGLSYLEDKTVGLSDWWQDFWDAEGKYEKTPEAGNPCSYGVEVVPRGVLFNDYVPGITSRSVSEYAITPSTLDRTFRTRFRFINMSAYSQFFVQFEGHNVTTIEVDGILIKPTDQQTDGFTVSPGQRVSVIVTSMQVPGSTPYRILVALDPSLAPEFPEKDAAFPNDCTLLNRAANLTLYTWGCLSYSGYSTPPCTLDAPKDVQMFTYNWGPSPDLKKWFSRKLHVPWKAHTHTQDAVPWNFDERTFRPLKQKVNKTQLLNVQPGNVHWLRIRDMPVELDPKDRGFGTMNTEWQAPTFPGLLQATWRGLSSYGLSRFYGRESNSIVVPDLKDSQTDPVVWLVFNTSNGDHPMHLHGHHMYLLYKGREEDLGENTYKRAIDEFNGGNTTSPFWKRFRDGISDQLDAVDGNPMSRDTLMTEKFQFLVVAFIADNPGVWALHCHNDFHAKSGMFKQIVERPAALRSGLGTWEVGSSGGGVFYPASGVDGVVGGAWERNVFQCLAEGKKPFVWGDR